MRKDLGAVRVRKDLGAVPRAEGSGCGAACGRIWVWCRELKVLGVVPRAEGSGCGAAGPNLQTLHPGAAVYEGAMEKQPPEIPRDRGSEGDQTPAVQDGGYKDIWKTETHANSPAEGSRPPEKKVHLPSRSSAAGPPHHRTSHSLDKNINSSSGNGAFDLQPSVFGRSGSSISGMTVPIRLDALSYLLNNAVLGAYKMLPQVPFYGGQCLSPVSQTCPYTQVGCTPHGTCMNQPQCSLPCLNQSAIPQPGYMPCVNQQVIQTRVSQPQSSSCLQCVSSAAAGQNMSSFPTCPPQSGVIWNSSGTGSAQDKAGRLLPEGNRFAGRSNDRFGSQMNNPFSGDGERHNSPPQRGFGRCGDNQDGDSWSGRQQRDFGRPPGRGRDDSGGRPWQSNSRGQGRDWQFGDRSRSTDFGAQKRSQDSPERSSSRGQSFKRGRWSGGRGRGGESRETSSWQQRNKADDASAWPDIGSSQDRFGSGGEIKLQTHVDKHDARDEDWETEYPEEAKAAKSSDSSVQRPENPSPSLPTSLASDWEKESERPKGKESAENVGLTNDGDLQETALVNSVNDQEGSKLPDKTLSAQGGVFETFMKGFASDLRSKEDENCGEDQESSSEQVDVETIDGKLPAKESDSSLYSSAVLLSAEGTLSPVDTVKTNLLEDDTGNNVFALVLSVEGESNKEIVFELVDATSG
ncbi:uncharacterized protein LOC142497901 [Ascaphus truei]|uniref:uncharacterized protein LOC142497901 n=1 Tax=Ascaphus truei TaxID=8439 RepID=UPI003F59C604